jgi:tetratricopeptide (TPR) repeat protein
LALSVTLAEPHAMPPAFQEMKARQVEIDRLGADVQRAPDAAARNQALAALLDTARAWRDERRTESSQLFMTGARALDAAGDPRRARELLREAAEQGVGDRGRAHAWMWLGIALAADNDTVGAASAFTNTRRLLAPQPQKPASNNYIHATRELARLHEWAKRYDEAIALLDELLAIDPALKPAVFDSVAIDRAELLFAAGRVADGEAAFDLFFARNPDFGMDDGRAVTLRLQRARRGGPLVQFDQRYVEELRAIWLGPHFRAMPASIVAASNLLANLQLPEERLSVAVEAVELWLNSRAAWQTTRSPREFDIAQGGAESLLLEVITQGPSRGHAGLALQAIARYRADYPESPNQRAMDRYQRRAMDAIARGGS